MDPNIFYQTKNDNVYKENNGGRVEKNSNTYLQKLPLRPTNSVILSNTNSIKRFPILAQALEFVESTNDVNVRLFSREKARENTNQSKTTYEFYCASFEAFAERYFGILLGNRHYYEIIPYDTPCRVYFDLEYIKKNNPHIIDGDRIVKSFIAYIINELMKCYPIECSYDKVIWMDSSDNNKYSCHLILHIASNIYFLNNSEVGHFVEKCYRNIMNHYDICSCGFKVYMNHAMTCEYETAGIVPNTFCDTCQLIVVSNKKSITFIADLSVYSMNRSFRLYLSNKVGSNRILQLSTSHQHGYFLEEDSTHRPYRSSYETKDCYKLLKHSLVVPYEFTPKKMSKIKEFAKIIDANSHLKQKTNVDSITYDNDVIGEENKKPSKFMFLRYSEEYKLCKPVNISTTTQYSSVTKEKYITTLDENDPSEHDQILVNHEIIDHKVKKYLNTVSNGVGFIRKISVDVPRKCITYAIGGYRFCHNRGCEHKSNHIYYVARLQPNVNDVVQKCHDFECKNYTSDSLFFLNSNVRSCDITNVSNIYSQSSSFSMFQGIILDAITTIDDVDLSDKEFNDFLASI